MRNAEEEKIQKILSLAKDLASQHTDEGIDKGAEILLQTIDEGNENPELLITAANYLLQGSRAANFGVKKEAASLIDKAVVLSPEDISVLESAIHGYELILNDFPDRLTQIIKLSLKILDLNPDHIEAMVILASHRERPEVALSLEDAINMLEWALEVDPSNTIVAFALSRLYTEAGKRDIARNLYKRVINNQPNSKDVKNAQHQIRSLQSKQHNKKYPKFGSN